MNTDKDIETAEPEIRSKTLLVLGLTFILPITLTLIAVYIFI